MTTGSVVIRSSRQAPPDTASQLISHSGGLSETNNAVGTAIQILRQEKQSISCPAKLRPSLARNLTIKPAGPSSYANRCVTRQVARTARTNRSMLVPTDGKGQQVRIISPVY